MTFVSLLILITVASLFGTILVLFYKNNMELKKNHEIEMGSLKKSINIHKIQMNNRTKGLRNYNFITANLNESLIVQSEINLF